VDDHGTLGKSEVSKARQNTMTGKDMKKWNQFLKYVNEISQLHRENCQLRRREMQIKRFQD
jgi:hypothetical protein